MKKPELKLWKIVRAKNSEKNIRVKNFEKP